ncbi:hypothetical protein F442_19724 [Phytophthora nicotianae P10297]|uniref:RxLR effector protein n=1 Tax=Phytophthora nicotianae P10297 TaxID=1317064 RepID=W2Y9K2_PHYNI|nr:hypothetical protein F442_19724 [Phytophthora nicotianae P10297]
MRLLLWVLLVTLVTFLSSGDAAPVDSNKQLERAAINKVTSRNLANDNSLKHEKRFLRGDRSNIVNLKGGDENEERKIGQKMTTALKSIKVWYLKWEQKILLPGFKKMAKKEMTYSKLMDRFRVRMMNSGRWGTPSGFKRYGRLYKDYLISINRADLTV